MSSLLFPRWSFCCHCCCKEGTSVMAAARDEHFFPRQLGTAFGYAGVLPCTVPSVTPFTSLVLQFVFPVIAQHAPPHMHPAVHAPQTWPKIATQQRHFESKLCARQWLVCFHVNPFAITMTSQWSCSRKQLCDVMLSSGQGEGREDRSRLSFSGDIVRRGQGGDQRHQRGSGDPVRGQHLAGPKPHRLEQAKNACEVCNHFCGANAWGRRLGVGAPSFVCIGAGGSTGHPHPQRRRGLQYDLRSAMVVAMARL